MAIAPLIVRITALGAAALGRAAAAMRAFGASVSSTARAAGTRAAAAFTRLAAALRAVAAAALRAAAAIGGPLRRALRAAADAAGRLTRNLALLAVRILAIGILAAPLVEALANLLPLAMHLAPAIIAAAAALLTLKFGLEGVGAALSTGLEGDWKEFEKQLKKLSPSAASFVRELVNVAQGWRDLKRLVQEKLFFRLDHEVRGVSKALGTLAATWLPKIATLFNSFAIAVAKGLQSKEFARQMDVIMAGVEDFIFGFLHAVRMLGRAFLDIAEVAAPAFGELGANIGIAAEKFATWIQEMKDNGTLKRWLDQAKETFNQLMDIGKEIGRVLGAIFEGTDEQGFLEGIKNSLSELADYLEGEDGQAMIQFFSDVANAAAGLIRTIGDVVRWFQEGIAILQDLFGEGEADIGQAAGAMAASISGIGRAFGWIENVIARLGMLVGAVRGAVAGINAALSAIRTTVYIDVITRRSEQGYIKPMGPSSGGGTGGGAKVRAHGGPVVAGMPYIVGDAGKPELFVPNQNGRIIPRIPTGGGVTLVWNGAMSGLDALFYRWFNESVRAGKLKPV